MHNVEVGSRDGNPVVPAGSEGDVPGLNAGIEARLEEQFRSKPVKIMWSMKDIAFTPEMVDELWMKTFPDTEVVHIEMPALPPGRC